MAKTRRSNTHTTQEPLVASSTEPSTQAENQSIPASAEPSTLLLNVEGLPLPTRARPFVVEYFPTPEQAAAERQARSAELDAQRDRAYAVLYQVENTWRKQISNAQQVVFNVAYRTKLGHVVAPLQYVIQIDVSYKLGTESLRRSGHFIFPPEIHGVPTKVRQIVVHSNPGPSNAVAFSGSTQGGMAISSSANPSSHGTLGMCLTLNDGSQVGITNSHVVGSDQLRPQVFPQGNSGAVIGEAAISFINAVFDGALIVRNQSQQYQEGIMGLDYPPSSYRFLANLDLWGNLALEHLRVVKYGAGSFKTCGSISNSCMRQIVKDLGEFDSVIEVSNLDKSFILGGDSGSVLVCEYSQGNETFPLVVGLNFAGTENGRLGYAIPFGRVLEQLGLTSRIPADRTVTV